MNIRSEQGIAAIGVVVMLLVVLSLLATALWQYSMFQTRIAARNDAYAQALYLAHAGAEAAKAAWIDKGAAAKLEGPLARVYYNSDTGAFQLEKPERLFGFIDIAIETDDDPEQDYRLTKIVSTATVGGVSRSVTLTTFPQRYGHQAPLNLYNAATGQILKSNEYIREYVIIDALEAGRALSFESKPMDRDESFSATVIDFEMDIDCAKGGKSDWYLGDTLTKVLHVEAEYVFFKNITLLYADRDNDQFAPETEYSIILKVPDGRGIEKDGNRYGVVYFDGTSVTAKKFRWRRVLKLWIIIPYYEYTLSEHDPPEIRDLKTYEGVLLAGKAFYFENGTNLLHPGPGQLIPIPEEEQNRHDAYKDMFVWE